MTIRPYKIFEMMSGTLAILAGETERVYWVTGFGQRSIGKIGGKVPSWIIPSN